MKLDQEFIKKVKPAIINTWQQIGSDLEACCAEEGEALNNDEAIECCIDADRPPAMPESISQVADGRWSRVTEGRVSTVRETWVVVA